MHRRTLLNALGALSLTGPARLYASPTSPTKLMVVFLRGAYDAASLLVPTHSSFYYESRPNIAIAQPSANPGSALMLDANWGLHPALRESLYPYWQRGELAFIPYAGINDLSRSHFETQDRIEKGEDPLTRRDLRSGFMNRLAIELTGKSPFAFTRLMPMAFSGELSVPNMSPKDAGRSSLNARQVELIGDMYADSALRTAVMAGINARAEVTRGLNREEEHVDRQAISSRGFELEARRLARLMRDRYDIGFVDVGGWDTHVGQGAATGNLAKRFEELGRGLAAMAEDLGSVWNKTIVVVISEFGRTMRENGNRGTDHGHGTVYWVMGGAIKGGRVVGEQISVTAASMFQSRDYQVLNEYRAVLGGLFARGFGLNQTQLERIFPGVQPRNLGLV